MDSYRTIENTPNDLIVKEISGKVNKTSNSVLFFSSSSLISVNESEVIKENTVFEVYGPFLSVECLLCHLKI